VRLHGSGGKYQGSYDLPKLEHWSRTAHAWMLEKKDVYIHFDNHQAGFAPANAQTLKALISDK